MTRKQLRNHVSIGNKKIGTDTIIFNMCAAHDCPSRKLGLCQLENPNWCYARQSELRFPKTLDYRRRQESIWENHWQELSMFFGFLCERKPEIKYVRFNESGDFKTQDDVGKLFAIAKQNPQLQFYCYTARKDLSFARRPKNLSICGSNWARGKMNKFIAVPEYSGNNAQCFGDCRKCNLCKIEAGITIENKLHGLRFNLLKGGK